MTYLDVYYKPDSPGTGFHDVLFWIQVDPEKSIKTT
jgi:hypothetical protein